MAEKKNDKEKIYVLKQEYERVNEFRWGFVVISCVLLLVIIFMAFLQLDNVDIDDDLAPYLCKQHGMIHMDEEYRFIVGKLTYLQIRCGNLKEVSDGYLVTYN